MRVPTLHKLCGRFFTWMLTKFQILNLNAYQVEILYLRAYVNADASYGYRKKLKFLCWSDTTITTTNHYYQFLWWSDINHYCKKFCFVIFEIKQRTDRMKNFKKHSLSSDIFVVVFFCWSLNHQETNIFFQLLFALHKPQPTNQLVNIVV